MNEFEERTNFLVRNLNDRFRTGDTTIPGMFQYTNEIRELLYKRGVTTNALVQKIHEYDDFNDIIDPQAHHDFGIFEFLGRTFTWRIRYFSDDSTLTPSNEPQSPGIFRVLTVLLHRQS